MVRCSTPDTLIGLGGGGSRVVYRFMEQEWILDEVLNNGPSDGDHGHDTLRATTIDTATGEEWHEDRVGDVQSAVSTAIENSEYDERDGYLEFEGPTIIPNELPRGWKNEQLTAANSIRNLRSDVGLNSWWLKNGRDPLENVNSRGFDSGVNRLRSVSKALYHITGKKDRNIDPVGVRPEGDVCIVTSLGGGTGSGLAINLATDLNERGMNIEDIHLYAVLPRSGAGIDIKTNAHAALSELEYAELNGESPFDTITLIPHLDEVNDMNPEFEMAAVRTILARQNGGDEVKKLRPKRDDQSSAPAYAPFTVASPVTLRYDFEAKEEAKEVVEETLDAKREELRSERDLYQIVEKYLKNAFPETAGAEIAGEESEGRLDFDDDGLKRAVELRRRIENDLWDTFLHSEALSVANLGETVEEIDEEFENICNDEEFQVDDAADELDRAREFIEVVPERLQDPLEAFALTERDGSEYKLVEALKQEITNVSKRRDLYEAISRITAEENPELSEKEAETIRTVLADVVIDDEIKFPSKRIKKPKLRDKIEYLESELGEYDEETGALEEQYQTVASDIRAKRSEWYTEINDEAEQLAAINQDKQTITTVLNDLSGEIEQKCREVKNADNTTVLEETRLNLDQIGPLGGENESINGIGPINAKLENMGLEKILAGEIENQFESVKRARRLEMEHGGGIFGANKAEEFVTAANNANEDDWFRINEKRNNTSVEDEFNASFNSNKLDLADEVESSEEEATEAIASAFIQTFTDDGATFVRHEHDSEYGVEVPAGNSPQTVRESLESGLKASTETDANDLLKDVMPVSGIEPGTPSTNPLDSDAADGGQNRGTMLQIVDAYLKPIATEYEEAKERRDQLTDGEDAPGLISRMKTLRGLAEGEDVVSAPDDDQRQISVDLPDPDDRRRESLYGSDFVETYEGIYTFDLDDSFKYENEDNPYVRPMDTQPTDLAGDPDDISDTDIVDNRETDIEQEFRRETSDLIENDKRAPYELSLFGNAEKVDNPAYKQHRIRQVYLSRAFEENDNIGQMYDQVYEQYSDRLQMPLENNPDMYNAETHPYGWTDDVTMVTFVGGIFLDNISLVSEARGYREMYQETYEASEFPGSHHTIGLGAMWDRWSVLGEWVTDAWEEATPDSDADFGGFVRRTKLFDPTNQKFIEEVKYRNETDGESAVDLFLDALTADAYENTVDIGEAEETPEEGTYEF